ncbi:MAG: putative methyltransferase-domain-containing protein [Lentinula lateritia]|uniref:Methyltransferase-domain-containing protein n=1 Tax=Lentinula lateritia TaxID=40482 RepID=A0ABQ8VC32_9AGAR|nr:MAG: putative methyltransferase-domain-containing protein [Lentinula lateritia]KAJ4486910.1 putative methyltransferase-domain-containing protein [Lentinula lateritia]
MFYYISFLRPPPLQVLPSSQVTIIPQIANDLRTESFEDSQVIFYSWLPAANNTFLDATKPVELTTWRQANAYKEINVPSPSRIRDGQSWRLILSPVPQRYSINLEDAYGAESYLGKTPFPVISMPIKFTRDANQNRVKQEKIERYYSFTVPNVQSFPTSRVDLELRITEQTSFDLDKKSWDSGIGLSSWLVALAGNVDIIIRDPSSSVASQLRKVLFSPGPRKIIELGAGTGIVSLTLGALRSVLSMSEIKEDDGCIVTTDLPSAMPLLEHNVSMNSHMFARAAVRPIPEILDWDAELPLYAQTLLGQLDAIIMADVTYNTASFGALIRTLCSLIKLSPVDKLPIILLGYKERDVAERSLWSMAADVGIHFERVGARQGAGGAPVEIWMGQIQGIQ